MIDCEHKTPDSDSEETLDNGLKTSIQRINNKYSETLKRLAENERQEKEGAD